MRVTGYVPAAEWWIARAPALRLRLFVLAAAAVAAVAALSLASATDWEHDLRAARDTIRSEPASGDLVIVEVDAASLRELNSWPWPRSLHAKVVEQLDRVDPAMIAFDIDFSSRSDPAEDHAFANALDRADTLVLLPAFRQHAGAGSQEYVDSEPIDMLRENAFLASVNIRPTEDGLVRDAMLGVATNGIPRPSLPAMLSGAQGTTEEQFRIDFAIEPDTIPRLSYADVVAGRADLSAHVGARFLIGATAIEMGDRYAVPRHGVVPGVVIQALAAETLEQGGVPQSFGPGAALALLSVALLLLMPRWHHWVRAAGFVASAGAILALPMIAETWFNATFAIVPALFALAATAVAAAIGLALRRYRQSRLIDPDTGLPNRIALTDDLGARGEITVMAARIDKLAEVSALLSRDDLPLYFAEIERRLVYVNDVEKVYRIEDDVLGWDASAIPSDRVDDHIEGLVAIFRSPVLIGAQAVDIDISIGVASGTGREAHSAVTGAALASQRAMAEGELWERYVEGDDTDGRWRLSLLAEMDEAMETGALWVAFQPKLDIASGAIASAEALVRWQHPVRGAIPPDSFIPEAERRGRIADLTLFVAGKAIDAIRDWAARGLDVGVAINVSATLLGNAKFTGELAQMIERAGIAPGKLTLEITESAAMHDPERAIAAMMAMRNIGVRLSIDDYGTGQCTLTYLKALPAHELKIDRSFVQSIEQSRSDHILVRSTIDVAHELGLSVVAEGIEDAACLDLLATLGCDTGQGYFIGKPMDAAAFEAHVRQRPDQLPRAA